MICLTVTNTHAPQIRMQWWRDVVDGIYSTGTVPSGSPVAESLAAAVQVWRHTLFSSPFCCALPAWS